MEILQGIVSKVRFSTEVSGNENSTSTSHVAIFEINKTPIELKLPGSIILENGDEVLLAGKVKKGLFRALAYKNMTNSVSGKGQVILHMLLGIIFTIVGIATIPMGIGLIFAPAGMYSIWHSRQLSNAYNLVTSTL
jgi:hypothetical protein